MQGEHGRRVRRPGRREVHAHARRQVMEAVLDAFDGWHGRRHGATRYGVANARMRLVPMLVIASLLLVAPAAGARSAAPKPPGSKPTWSKADKHAFGTSATRASWTWFTLRDREMTEVYYPDLGTPSIRDMEFAVSRPGRRWPSIARR